MALHTSACVLGRELGQPRAQPSGKGRLEELISRGCDHGLQPEGTDFSPAGGKLGGGK